MVLGCFTFFTYPKKKLSKNVNDEERGWAEAIFMICGSGRQ